MNPLGFSPALLRGGDGRLGRSLDQILLYSQSYHSWTIVSVTAVTFTARSVHSRAADPDTLHFHGPAAARARSMAIGILPAVACPSTATAPSDTVAERLGFAQTSFVPCWRVRCHAFLRFSTFIVFVGAIAVVAVGAAEPSVVVDGTALVFRLPRFLYGRGDP